MKLARRAHYVELEPAGLAFIWADAAARDGWTGYRRPAGDADIRQIEDIPLVELRAAAIDRDPVGVARIFGVRRLSAPARARIEQATA